MSAKRSQGAACHLLKSLSSSLPRTLAPPRPLQTRTVTTARQDANTLARAGWNAALGLQGERRLQQPKRQAHPSVGNKRFLDFDLAGGVYLVTGGARGLGLAMAEGLVEAGGKGQQSSTLLNIKNVD